MRIPFYLSGEAELKELMSTPIGLERNAVFFKKIKNIDVHTRTFATKIDRENKLAEATQLDTQRNLVYPYDLLVLAPGATPIIPPIQGIHAQGVLQYRTLNDAGSIVGGMTSSKERKAVVIGGGMINLEFLEPLMENGFEVSLVEMKNHLLPSTLDSDMSEFIGIFFEGELAFGAILDSECLKKYLDLKFAL
jgi:NAD(P)H-nitrite reductase large subunit